MIKLLLPLNFRACGFIPSEMNNLRFNLAGYNNISPDCRVILNLPSAQFCLQLETGQIRNNQ